MAAYGDRLHVIIWKPGKNWHAGLPVTQQPLDAHHAYFSELNARGQIGLAGPFLDEMAGGLAIVNVTSRDEAEAIMHADPAIQTQVFVGEVRPFFVVFAKI